MLCFASSPNHYPALSPPQLIMSKLATVAKVLMLHPGPLVQFDFLHVKSLKLLFLRPTQSQASRVRKSARCFSWSSSSSGTTACRLACWMRYHFLPAEILTLLLAWTQISGYHSQLWGRKGHAWALIPCSFSQSGQCLAHGVDSEVSSVDTLSSFACSFSRDVPVWEWIWSTAHQRVTI